MHTAKISILINTSLEQAWGALVNPEMIKQYLFDTTVSSDWKVGSPIVYRGEWQGKTYEDKGVILKIEPKKILESTYWSSMSGSADIPENYKKVTYELEQKEDGVLLSITQDNNGSEEAQKHSEENWSMILSGLKALLEN